MVCGTRVLKYWVLDPLGETRVLPSAYSSARGDGKLLSISGAFADLSPLLYQSPQVFSFQVESVG